jgi:hypothetical protein
MQHFIYSVHACSGSKWSKGYTEFYMTDTKTPTAERPVKSIIVLQIGETEEIVKPGTYDSHPSESITVRLIRAVYNDDHTMKSQNGYLFELTKYDIAVLIIMCQEKIDEFLEGKEVFDVNDSRFVNWGYKVAE